MLRSLFGLALATLIALGGAFAPPAAADIDVYSTPGEHTINGRQWRTWCEPYSQTARCRTELVVAGKWTFNNLTYLPSPKSLWVGNPLAEPGEHTIGGRLWYTECETPATGRNGCRSYIWSGDRFVFNNLVRFGVIPSNLEELYVYRPPADPTPPTTPPTSPPITNYSMYKGPNPTSRVTLTFDDCPNSLSAFKTTAAAARDLGISLQLFPTGNCITSGKFDPAYARSMGHYVFNHSVSHPNLTTLSYDAVLRQLSAPGVVTTYGRPPYGAWNDTVKRAYDAKGMRIWLWNIDTNDWRSKTTSQVVSYVVANAKPGNSVLMHMQWNGFNGPALKAMRDGLAAKGIGVCRNQGPTEVKPASLIC
ncbi:polysaccharide deacetylase family protein [Tessaracoccus flavus]|uniref:NodB homology domain-containing protein n=1 Tax=Tessaracoccus flavus TaxID=1610493 RepID=A0A1Q2CBP2_9ACTN|nr:polysaccharide deacetylase family protein [Tessaracoccus flavus]AQP43520.1 hypothetical protein RPIT_00710 [Tessaracoccus flavus]